MQGSKEEPGLPLRGHSNGAARRRNLGPLRPATRRGLSPPGPFQRRCAPPEPWALPPRTPINLARGFTPTVIASEAWRSIFRAKAPRQDGLLRCARNDGVGSAHLPNPFLCSAEQAVSSSRPTTETRRAECGSRVAARHRAAARSALDAHERSDRRFQRCAASLEGSRRDGARLDLVGTWTENQTVRIHFHADCSLHG